MTEPTQLIEQLAKAVESNLAIYSAMYGVPINSESITHHPAMPLMFKDSLEVLAAARAHLEQPTEPAPSISQLVAILNPSSLKELVQRGANLWPEAPAEIKEFADLVTTGKVMQDYKAQEPKRKTINPTLEN